MIHGIQMTKQGMETKIAVLEAKVEHMMVHTKELTLRVRANEKVVASVSLLGVIACTFIGAGYFAPKADASIAGEWIQRLRDHESEQTRTAPEDSINNSLQELEWDYGSDDTPKQEELLQLPSNGDSESIRRGYDRCSDRSWIRFIQERTGKNCWSGHPREKN